MADWGQLVEVGQEYRDTTMQLAAKTAEIEQELREDVAAGWLSPQEADVILAGIIADNDNADWPWQRWKEARRVRDGGSGDGEWAGSDGLVERLEGHLGEGETIAAGGTD
jgi:hypothetical protein